MNQGKVAVVTGGASGIGEAVVRRVCEDGYSVAINYNSSEAKAEALASELSLSGYTVGIYKADVSDSTEANEMIKKITLLEQALCSKLEIYEKMLRENSR